MQKQSKQDRFKKYLCKIGSGKETGRSLTRKESADALHLLLHNIPTPAQTGGFLIAHRIKRPTVPELAGMLDTYNLLGPSLKSNPTQTNPICFGMPFDGRNRTAPIYPLTTLILLAMKQPVILKGGHRMPVKYGVTSCELFTALGLNLKNLSMEQIQEGFLQNNFALIFQPDHFPLAENLNNFREEIGKRPPIASLELLWTAHEGKHINISGFVHSPTEERHCKVLNLHGEEEIITIKGLEGSIDIPISRSCITGHYKNNELIRIIMKPQTHNCQGKDMNWEGIQKWQEDAFEALKNTGPLQKSVIWNAGIYLFFSKQVDNISEGLKQAERCLTSGLAQATLDKLIIWRKNINYKNI